MTEKEIDELIKPDALKFLSEHKSEDPENFALKYHKNKDLPIRAISEQIFCYKKAVDKLPHLSQNNLLFEKVALEQSSGEITASYKASLLKGEKIIDLTGGLGIDDIFISNNFKQLIYCEQDSIRIKLFEHNIKLLKIQNILIRSGNSIDTLASFPDNYFDWIYIDPSRRNENKRFIGLKDCSPDIIAIQDTLFAKATNILIKASPALELEEARKEIRNLKEFIVLSVDNECKEVLLILNKNENNDGLIIRSVSVNSRSGKTNIISAPYSEKYSAPVASDIHRYFYEPDAAIIKARLTKRLVNELPLFFINSRVDYLTSDTLIKDFPGRQFKIEKVLPYKRHAVKVYLKERSIIKVNIARRDFPDAPEVIRKDLGLKDGGNDYLFFTKDSGNNLIVIFCRKLDELKNI